MWTPRNGDVEAQGVRSNGQTRNFGPTSAPAVPRRGTDWRPRQGRVHTPRHFSSASAQIVDRLGTMQNEWAEAQDFSSVDTYRAPFTNLTFDWVCPEDLRERVTATCNTPYVQYVIPGDHWTHGQAGDHPGGGHHLPVRNGGSKRFPDILQARTEAKRTRTTSTRPSCRWASPTTRSWPSSARTRCRARSPAASVRCGPS